jgi:hypothetical protein
MAATKKAAVEKKRGRGRPPRENKAEEKTRSILMPVVMWERVETLATKNKRAVNRELEVILEEYFEWKDNQKT